MYIVRPSFPLQKTFETVKTSHHPCRSRSVPTILLCTELLLLYIIPFNCSVRSLYYVHDGQSLITYLLSDKFSNHIGALDLSESNHSLSLLISVLILRRLLWRDETTGQIMMRNVIVSCHIHGLCNAVIGSRWLILNGFSDRITPCQIHPYEPV